MASGAKPGPIGRDDSDPIDSGTLALTRHHPPGPLGRFGPGNAKAALRNTARYLFISQFHSKTAVPLTDDQGNPVLDISGNPMVRPSDVPPSFFVDAGLASTRDPEGAQAYANLLYFDRGGLWDVQRVGPDRGYVDAFKDYANLAIGLYGAAAGIPEGMILNITNWKAGSSVFAPGTVYDPIHTNTPARIIHDIRTGYRLVNSGRIGPSTRP